MTEPYGPTTPTDPGDESIPTKVPEPTSPETAPSTPGPVKIPKRLILGAAVLVVIVGAVIGYLVFQKSDPTAAKVGDCVKITGASNLATATRLSCDDELALYVVTAAGKAVTCDSSEVSYTGSTRDRTKLCLFYNVRVGDCLTVTPNGDGDAKGACTAGTLKVLSVSTDTADKTKCPAAADEARADVTHNRLICFATVR